MTSEQLMPEWMTLEWLSEVIGAEVRGVTADRIGDGLVGMNLRLRLTQADALSEPTRLVVKLP